MQHVNVQLGVVPILLYIARGKNGVRLCKHLKRLCPGIDPQTPANFPHHILLVAHGCACGKQRPSRPTFQPPCIWKPACAGALQPPARGKPRAGGPRAGAPPVWPLTQAHMPPHGRARPGSRPVLEPPQPHGHRVRGEARSASLPGLERQHHTCGPHP